MDKITKCLIVSCLSCTLSSFLIFNNIILKIIASIIGITCYITSIKLIKNIQKKRENREKDLFFCNEFLKCYAKERDGKKAYETAVNLSECSLKSLEYQTVKDDLSYIDRLNLGSLKPVIEETISKEKPDIELKVALKQGEDKLLEFKENDFFSSLIKGSVAASVLQGVFALAHLLLGSEIFPNNILADFSYILICLFPGILLLTACLIKEKQK